MRILITGGAGFIGSHLCERLLGEGHFVYCFDNLCTSNKANIEHLLDNKKFVFNNLNVINPIPKNLIPKKLDFILHFASPAGPHPDTPKSYLRMPISTYLVNSIGTHNLCELALETKAKIIFSSTSEVYGDPLEHPQKETYFGNVNPTGERACYDESKRFGEMVVSVFNRKHNLPATILRVFNTYGSRMNPLDGRALPLFINQALKGKNLEIFGDGKQTRSFCYIDDLIEGIIKSMKITDKTLKIINLGNQEEITVNKLADLIIKLTGSRVTKTYKKKLENDPERRRPDISQAKKILKWQPKTDLLQGLEKTIESFKKLN